MSCATPNLLSGPLGHVPETAGHVAEIVGHDPETAGHLHPKYASAMIAKRIRAAHSFLASAKESIALGLGIDLGAMHQNLDDIDPAEFKKMSTRLGEFLPSDSGEAVRTCIEQLGSRSSMGWGTALFGLASSQLKRVQY